MDLFQRQLTFINKRNPRLAQQLQSGIEDAPVQLQATKTQYPALLVRIENGFRALHHPDDPIQHCRKLLAPITDLTEKHNIIVLGGALGYLPLLIQQAHPRFRNLMILYPSVSVFRVALQTVDLAALLKNPRVHFIVGADDHNVYQELLPFVIEWMANPPVIIGQPPVTSTFPQWAAEAQRQINAVMQLGRSGLRTKMNDGPLTLSNLFQNMDVIQSSAGIKPLYNQYKDVPAVIVAAGPSLSKNIAQLKEAQDKMLIIATDTAFETCLHHGIQPHFVVTVDPTELNLRHFKSENYDESAILLFDPEARPEFPAKFQRVMTYMTDKHDFFLWLDQQTGGKGVIKKGGMVSQAGMYAASYFGCNPIILIGQDLALDPKSGATHTEQAANVRQATFDENDKEYVAVSRIDDAAQSSREQLFWVEGIDGNPVPTMHNFMVYIHMLAEDVKQLNATVIDATEGGAKIPGTKIMTLSDTIQQYGKSNLNIREVLEDHLSTQDSQSNPSGNIKQELKKLLMSRLQKAQKGRVFLQRADQISLPVLERKLDEFRSGIMSNPVAEYIIEYGAPKELFEYLKLAPANATGDVKKANTIHRFESLLSAVESAAERLLDQLG